MGVYIIKRLLLLIPTLLLTTVFTFFSTRIIPGDIIDVIASMQEPFREGKKARAEMRAKMEKELGLDVPIYVQYGRWLGNVVLKGDLGNSLWTKAPVTEEIAPKIPVSFELGFIGLIVAMLIALPIGLFSAIRQDSLGDYIARSFAIMCIAVPSFWLGTMVMVYPSVWWGWTPPMEYVSIFEDPYGNIKMFIIPGIILGMWLSGMTMRMTRSMMLEVLRQDYIRTAWSKGLKESVIIIRHAVRNSFIPVITLIGLSVPVLIGGTVVIERIFVLPGMGSLLVESAFDRDYTLLSGVTLTYAIAVLAVNLMVDLTYGFMDPRIRYR